MYDDETKEFITNLTEQYFGRLPTDREDLYCSGEFESEQCVYMLDELFEAIDLYTEDCDEEEEGY